MKSFPRSDRIGGLIKKNLSDLLQKKINDPRLQMTTITNVKMSSDLRRARIYFVKSGGEKSKVEAIEGFKNALGYVKRTLARQLGLRYMPELKFFYDESFDHGSHIDKILHSLDIKNESDNTPFEKQ